MLETLTVIALLCAIPAGLGATIDRLMLNRDKGRLHLYLLKIWVKLDETRTGNLPGEVAGGLFRLHDRIFVRDSLLVSLILVIALSTVMTSILLSAGLTIDGVFPNSKLQPNLLERPGIVPFPIYIFGIAALLNLPFDLLTLRFTHRLLSIIRDSSLLRSAVVIAIDLLFAAAMAFLSALLLMTYLPVAIELPGTSMIPEVANVSAIDWWNSLTSGPLTPLVTSLSTALPTAIFLLALLATLVAKATSRSSLFLAKYFIEKATEVEDSRKLVIFTMVGSLCSGLALVITSLVKVANEIRLIIGKM